MTLDSLAGSTDQHQRTKSKVVTDTRRVQAVDQESGERKIDIFLLANECRGSTTGIRL